MRRLLATGLSIVILTAAAVALLSYLADEPGAAGLRVEEVNGTVRISAADGSASAALVGRILGERERVTTGPGSGAVLALGDATKIRLAPTSTVQMTGRDEQTVTLELEGGALEARVTPSSSALRVGSRGRQLLATDGVFGMGVGADGMLVVDVSEGRALTQGLQGVPPVLEAGTRATVTPDGRATLSPIPDDLLLSVQWPDESRTRLTTTQVQGTTAPGSWVHVDGGQGAVDVMADAQGHFVADVGLLEGTNALSVKATDQLGKPSAVQQFALEVDRRGPVFRGGIEYTAGP